MEALKGTWWAVLSLGDIETERNGSWGPGLGKEYFRIVEELYETIVDLV